MGSARRPGIRLAASLLAGAAMLAPAVAFAAHPASLYYERALMSAAGARCGLFTPQIASALSAAAAQARGAALRSGMAAAEVKDVGARALAKAARTPCGSQDLKIAADRVRTAFEGWTRLSRMTFAGENAPWLADRGAYRSPRWRLSQAGRAGAVPATFGVAGNLDRSALLAVAAFPGGEQPYAARLVMRDEGRSPLPWLGAPRARPLPPRSASLVILAEARDDADPGLLGAGTDSGIAFRFPQRASDALAELDPRERFAVEFLFRGDRVQIAVFEVGDFAAGRAFLAAAPAAASVRRSAG